MLKNCTIIFKTTKKDRKLIEESAKSRDMTLTGFLLAAVHGETDRAKEIAKETAEYRRERDEFIDIAKQAVSRVEDQSKLIGDLVRTIERVGAQLENAMIPMRGEGLSLRQLRAVLSGTETETLLALPLAERGAAYDRLALLAARFGHRDRAVRAVAPKTRIKVLPADFWNFVQNSATAEEKREIRAALLGTEETEEREPNGPRPRRLRPA